MPPGWSTTPRRCGDDADRAHAAGLLHRPPGLAAAGQPAHHRVRPRHAETAVSYIHDTTGKQPSTLDWDDLDEPLIARFLDHLEHERHNSPRTRNLRLTAIRSLFKYSALRHPEHAAGIQRVLAIAPKRFEKRTVTYLTSREATALIDAPDRQRWEGRRDHAMFTLAVHASLRVSELIGLN